MTIDARLEQIDTRLAGLEKHLLGNGQPGYLARQEQRVNRLERWRAYITGAVVTLSGLVAILVTLGAAWAHHK